MWSAKSLLFFLSFMPIILKENCMWKLNYACYPLLKGFQSQNLNAQKF